jgi:hypothetical protein
MGLSESEQKEQGRDDNDNILTKEVDSWSNFAYALSEENRLLFKDEYFSAESLFMILILQQQKTINDLIGKTSVIKKPK